jgi:outer membrane protein OmpA-like peptidoglycan-associated protein
MKLRTGMPLSAPLPLAAVARTGLVLALTALLAPSAAAADVTLHAVPFPERSTLDIPFAATVRTPAGGSLEGEVKAEGAQTRVAISWKRMKPAILFGGNVTSYVVWVVTKDGVAENLGELFVRDAKGDATFATGRKVFGLMVTAEPFPGVTRPSDVVVFTGGAPKPGKAKSEPFAFGRFAADSKPSTPSIASLEWTSEEPLELVQARAILAMAQNVKAGDQDQRTVREAETALAQAVNSTRGGSPRAVVDYARRAAALASEAIRDVARRRAAEEAARLEAEQRAKEASLREEAADEADRRRQSESALAQIEELRQKTVLDLEQTRQAAAALAAAKAQLEAETVRLGGEKAALQQERDALAARLGGALDKVATTTKTARGLVVNLPGISFDTGKATLKPDTRVTVGKLAGILLMIPELNIRVEGYTDSIGKAGTNLKLSTERARNVFGLLREQGIAETRMTFEGYGAENPAAANDTADGRAKNRRVEIIVAEGQIQAAPKAAAAEAPATRARAAGPAEAPKK